MIRDSRPFPRSHTKFPFGVSAMTNLSRRKMTMLRRRVVLRGLPVRATKGGPPVRQTAAGGWRLGQFHSSSTGRTTVAVAVPVTFLSGSRKTGEDRRGPATPGILR